MSSKKAHNSMSPSEQDTNLSRSSSSMSHGDTVHSLTREATSSDAQKRRRRIVRLIFISPGMRKSMSPGSVRTSTAYG
ncbi:hypothetical protein B0H12DRAFT_1111315 [Mycena haematopus]|nr:hypothetical protein B0H12DRAFT_1111315 [Mycena haematopus]